MFSAMTNISKISGVFLIVLLIFCPLKAADDKSHQTGSTNENSHSDEFDASRFIMDHIKDSHEWHLWTDSHGHHVSVYLPVILYSKTSGLNLFFSGKLAHGHEYKGFKKMDEGDYAGKIVEINDRGEISGIPLDFSFTKNVAGMIVAVIVMLIVFIKMGNMYKNDPDHIPKGFFGFLEILIIFIRDQVARPNIGEKKYLRHMPYLLTVFFFILINNIFGLIPFFPFGANVTGNIAVTMVLALFTFVITTISGTKDYWKHIIAAPGVPIWLAPLIVPIEIAGMFIRPFALMIRLFANITAGHIIVISLVCLIFIFKSLAVAPITIMLVLFMDFLEFLVAFLQAYVFTLLSALFIGLAAKEHQH